MGLLAVRGRGLDDVRSRCAELWEVISLKCLQERYIFYFRIPHNKLRLPLPPAPKFHINYCSICSQEDCFQKHLKTSTFAKFGEGAGALGRGQAECSTTDSIYKQQTGLVRLKVFEKLRGHEALDKVLDINGVYHQHAHHLIPKYDQKLKTSGVNFVLDLIFPHSITDDYSLIVKPRQCRMNLA